MPRGEPQTRVPSELLFGPAGAPHSTSKKTTQGGIMRVHELGLGCMEVEFVNGVRMNYHTALAVGEVARKRGIRLTAHGPYFINLNSNEEEKVIASKERILQTARVTHDFGGDSITFHAAYYMKTPPEQVYEKVKRCLVEIVEQLDQEKKRVTVRPELMGKASQFGTLNEILRLSEEIEGVAPCIDFAHLHARTGKFNTYDEFYQMLEQTGEKLGREALENVHLHLSGISYGPKGERKHLNMEESDSHYIELIQALKDHDVKGIAICESPNLEDDALMLQRVYRTSG